jgi:hypothetical protein
MRNALVVVSLLLASTTGFAEDRSVAESAGNCVTTPPPNPAFIPSFSPFDSPFNPPSGQFWYGTDSLFTLLNAGGTWRGYHPTSGRPEAYFNKLFFWRLGYDWRSEFSPRLFVSAVRLDQYAPVISADPAASAGLGSSGSMMTGIDLPAPGCWEITAKYGSDSLSFVVSVQP